MRVLCKLTCFILSLLLSLTAYLSANAQSESVSQSFCDPSFDFDAGQLPTQFPGVYYLDKPSFESSSEAYTILEVDANGEREIQLPFPMNQYESPLISADNRYIALRPEFNESKLGVYDRLTQATATLDLTQEELDALHNGGFRATYQNYVQRFAWEGNSALVLKFFDEDFVRIVGQTRFVIENDPLRIIRQSKVDVNYPSLPVPVDSRPLSFLSPSDQFASVLYDVLIWGEGPYRAFQIYELAESSLLFDLQPTVAFYAVSRAPVWSPNEQQVFIYIGDNQQYKQILTEVDVNANFAFSTAIHDRAEALLGKPLALVDTPPPQFSQDGELLAFYLNGYADPTSYIVVYELSSKALTVICDVNPFDFGHATMITWSPDNHYVGYWSRNGTIFYDRYTGEGYSLPGLRDGYIGWNAATNLAPVADAGSDQTAIANAENLAILILDGSASTDPDGTIVNYSWSLDGVEIATGVNPTVTLGVGFHVIMLTVTDDEGATDTDEVVIDW